MTARTQGSDTSYHTMRLSGDEPIEINTSGESVKYTYNPGGSLALGMNDENGNTQSFGLDLHTDIVFTLNQAGTLTSSTLYRPYGEKVVSTGTLSNPLGYQSDYTDQTTGLIDMGERS